MAGDACISDTPATVGDAGASNVGPGLCADDSDMGCDEPCGSCDSWLISTGVDEGSTSVCS